MGVRAVCLAACLLLSSCAGSVPSIIKYSPWPASQKQSQSGYHLLIEGRLNQPELLAKTVSGTYAGMRSWQAMEDIRDLPPWLAAWRPEGPVLHVQSAFALQITSSAWTAVLSGSGRFQPYVFDTSLARAKAEARVTRKEGLAGPSRKDLDEWVARIEPELYGYFARNLSRSLPALAKTESILQLHSGKDEPMKLAHAFASSGSWTEAAKIWQEEARRDSANFRVHHNLSVFAEIAGDWEEALRHQASAAENARSFYKWEEIQRFEALKGLVPLRQAQLKPPFKPGSPVAVLLLENMTNDLDAPSSVRNSIVVALKGLGASLVPIHEIDERLDKAGFTDGGQFRASTLKELGKIAGADFLVMGEVDEYRILPREEVKASLRVVHAPSGTILFAKTFQDVAPPELSNDIGSTAWLLRGAGRLLLKKATRTALKEESDAVGRRFASSFPLAFQ